MGHLESEFPNPWYVSRGIYIRTRIHDTLYLTGHTAAAYRVASRRAIRMDSS